MVSQRDYQIFLPLFTIFVKWLRNFEKTHIT